MHLTIAPVPPVSSRLAVAGCFIGIAVVGVIDYLTGYEMRVFPLYFVPVGLGAWWVGRDAGLSLSVAGIVAWELSNRLAGMRYSSLFFDVWNVTVQFAALVAFALLLTALRARMIREQMFSRTDGMTGLANSLAFYERAGLEIERARRYGRSVALAYIDLDNFKQINDRLGHQEGDQVLIAAASAMRRSCRQSDLAARMGGDEFVLLLPEIDREALSVLMTRLQKNLLDAMKARGWPVTASIGAVCFVDPPAKIDRLVASADALMFQVKKKGKNSVLIEDANRLDEVVAPAGTFSLRAPKR